MTPEVEFAVAPWMFGEGPEDDPFPCDCGPECQNTEHSEAIQDWFRRMQERCA